jgi:hypothetical protein
MDPPARQQGTARVSRRTLAPPGRAVLFVFIATTTVSEWPVRNTLAHVVMIN